MMLQLSYLEAALNQGPRPDLFDLETEKHTNILIYIIHKYIKMCTKLIRQELHSTIQWKMARLKVLTYFFFKYFNIE